MIFQGDDMSDNKRPNYKIYYFGKNHYDKIVLEKFYAENDDAAYAHLNTLPSNGKTLYYAPIHYVSTVDSKGNRSPEVDIDEHHALGKWIHEDEPFLKRMWEEVKDFFVYWLVDRPKDFYYWLRDLKYLLKNKEAYSNQWNLDYHLLESIERNVPSLIKNSYALAFIDDAILQLHGNEPEFDLDKFHRDNCMGYPKEVEELAVKIQNEEYNKLLLYVKLYKYYAAFGDIDFDNPDEVAFDKEWRHTLPIKPGTYDEISDIKKMTSLAQEYWNKTWEWVKKHGQKLND